MGLYEEEILHGLDEVPSPNVPGVMIVTGDSQPILTGSKPFYVIMAGCKYGRGKILVAGHDGFIFTFDQTSEPAKIKFAKNLKRWFADDEELSGDFIIRLDKIADKMDEIEKYRIVIWEQNLKLSEEAQAQLLSYIDNGGSLFCCVTIWGHLQCNPHKSIKDICVFNFLKDFTGIILTSDYTFLSGKVELKNNQAKHGHFDVALEKILSNPENEDEKSFQTVQYGIDIMHDLDLIDEMKITEIKEKIRKFCETCGVKTAPCSKEPVKDKLEKNTLNLMCKCLFYSEGEKAPNVKDFPGDFDEPPNLLENVKITLSTKFEERLSTGYYLPAGATILITVDSEDFKHWSVRIGAHSDDLTNCDKYYRWPKVSLVKKLSKEMCFSSPFGGLVYFESPNKGGNLAVSVSNVVEAPYFDLEKAETVEGWAERRKAPGLWAEIAGRNIIFTSPSHTIRELEDPEGLINFWDGVVKGHHDLRGTNPEDFRRERVVNDRQPSAGYMHSGYPIVTHLDCCEQNYDECIYDLEKLNRKGCWGLFHELGHNMQRGEWTFDGAGEVTVNIFSLHAFRASLERNVTEVAWLQGVKGAMKKYFSKQPTYNDWKNNCGVALFTFAQLVKHFGWESMYEFMSQYEKDIKTKTNLPHNNEEKIDQWVIRYSKIVGRNIKPQFQMFGLPVSDHVDGQIAGLEPWCPVEEKDPETFFAQ